MKKISLNKNSFLGVLGALAVFFSVSASADDARSKVVAKVGPRTITAGELEDRMAEVPGFQLATFGKTPLEIKKAFLEQVLVRDALLSQGAEAKHLESKLPTSQALTRARSDAALRALRAQVGPASAITTAEIERYYQENRARYDSPERYNLFRILCKSKDEATAVLDAAKKDGQLMKFEELAREHSIDKATHLRGGNLGFVTADGTSNEPGLKVDPALVKAAVAVKDGEFVPAPVEEAGAWAVIWRRGTVGASKRTLRDAEGQIRDTLHKEKLEQAQKKLIADLRARDLKFMSDIDLQGIEVKVDDGATVPRRRPAPAGSVSAGTAASAPPRP
jgi:peptidyl-prolyl cis-trans isomerase C